MFIVRGCMLGVQAAPLEQSCGSPLLRLLPCWEGRARLGQRTGAKCGDDGGVVPVSSQMSGWPRHRAPRSLGNQPTPPLEHSTY